MQPKVWFFLNYQRNHSLAGDRKHNSHDHCTELEQHVKICEFEQACTLYPSGEIVITYYKSVFNTL